MTKTETAVSAAGDAWDERATLWWAGRGRTDAQNNKSPLFRITVAGVQTAGDTPDDWSAEYEEAAARTYVDAYYA